MNPKRPPAERTPNAGWPGLLARLAPVLLLAGATALYLFHLGRAGLFDPAEGLYAEIPREMIALHDWLTPHLNYLRYFEKPPLAYWLNAISFEAFGLSEFTARLPTAVAAIAGIGLVYAIGRDLWSRRAGLAAGAVLGTSFGYFVFGRIMLPDMLFITLLTAAFWGFSRGLLRPASQRAAVLGGYAAMAGAVLAKGLIGVVFPVLAIAAFLVCTRDWRLWRRLEPVRGGVVFLAITVPWHVLVAWKNPGFLWFYFVHEHVLRYLGTREADYAPVPVVTYLILTAVWFCPWVVFLPAALRRQFSRRPDGAAIDRGVVLVWCWAGAVVGFFALSSGRQEHYALPALPALALAMGRLWDDEIGTPREGIRAGRLLPAWLGLIAFSACLIPAASLFPRLEHLRFYNLFPTLGPAASMHDPAIATARVYLVPGFADLVPMFETVVVLIVIGTGISAWAWFRRRTTLAFACLVGALIVGLATLERGFALFAPHRSVAELGRVLDSELAPGEEILIDGKFDNHAGIDFYTRRRVRVYRGRAGDLLYGSHYPDAGNVFVPDGEFERLWRGPKRVFLLSDNPDMLAQLRSLAPGTFVLGRTGSTWLFVNRVAVHRDAIRRIGAAERPESGHSGPRAPSTAENVE